jgi:peptide/nickel transport system ATP-binding protein
VLTSSTPAPSQHAPKQHGSPLLDVRGLSVRFPGEEGVVAAVQDVSFSLDLGATMSIIGESGSGKTVTMRALMRLLPRTAVITGRVLFEGVDVIGLDERRLRAIRGPKIAMIFQDPMTALDPVYTIGAQIVEVVVTHEGTSHAAARARARELLDMVQIPSADRRLDAYPHELSGGLRQRAMIALALSCRPKLLLADEPTTALDATVQIQILLLIRELQRALGMAVILVTHDIGVACEIAETVAVMYAGRFVEAASIGEIIASPRHPYTVGLLASTIDASSRKMGLTPIPGSPPDMSNLPKGCAFAPRCARAVPVCTEVVPAMTDLGKRHVRCHLFTSESIASTEAVPSN